MGQQINDNRGCPVENQRRRKKKPKGVEGESKGLQGLPVAD